jgi:hypothetical protein
VINALLAAIGTLKKERAARHYSWRWCVEDEAHPSTNYQHAS